MGTDNLQMLKVVREKRPQGYFKFPNKWLKNLVPYVGDSLSQLFPPEFVDSLLYPLVPTFKCYL